MLPAVTRSDTACWRPQPPEGLVTPSPEASSFEIGPGGCAVGVPEKGVCVCCGGRPTTLKDASARVARLVATSMSCMAHQVAVMARMTSGEGLVPAKIVLTRLRSEERRVGK